MRKLAVAFLFGLNTLVANAQIFSTEKPVLCSDPKTIIESVSKDYQEEPFWVGKDDQSRFVMMVNKKTGSWTFIQFNDKIACVLGTGNQGKLLNLERQI
jgi:hypothetical protein